MAGIEISADVREVVKQRLRLAAQIARPLADRYVGNPRQVKRFLNTLTLRVAVAKAYGVTPTLYPATSQRAIPDAQVATAVFALQPGKSAGPIRSALTPSP